MELNVITKDNDPKLIPESVYGTALGYDLRSASTYEPWDWKVTSSGIYYLVVNTGVRIEFPPNLGAFLLSRSGLDFKQNIAVIAKVIDPDYRGDIKVKLVALDGPLSIYKYDKIAQLVFVERYSISFNPVDKFTTTTKRNDKGFGHTGLAGIAPNNLLQDEKKKGE